MSIISLRDAKFRIIKNIQNLKSQLNIIEHLTYKGIKDPIADYLGIDIEEKKLSFDFGGYLPKNNISRPKPIIWIDPNSTNYEHRNFTFFHEISHHLIREDNELYSFLNDIANVNNDLNSLEENLANIGAAEFLIPSTSIYTLIQEKGFSISLLPELDALYPVSKPAIAIQLAQCAPHKCFIVVCNFGIPPNNHIINNNRNYIKPCLYIQYSTNSPSQEKYMIAKYTTISSSHVLHDVYENKINIRRQETIPFRSGTKWHVDCDAIYYCNHVYATFNITPPNLSTALQPSLF